MIENNLDIFYRVLGTVCPYIKVTHAQDILLGGSSPSCLLSPPRPPVTNFRPMPKYQLIAWVYIHYVSMRTCVYVCVHTYIRSDLQRYFYSRFIGLQHNTCVSERKCNIITASTYRVTQFVHTHRCLANGSPVVAFVRVVEVCVNGAFELRSGLRRERWRHGSR